MVHPNALRGNKKESRANRYPIKETDLYVKKISTVKHRVTSTFNDDPSSLLASCVFQGTRKKRAKKRKREKKENRKRYNEQKMQKEIERNSFYCKRFIPSSLFFDRTSCRKTRIRVTRVKRVTPRRGIIWISQEMALFFRGTPSVCARLEGSRITARFAHTASNHDQGTMYNSFFMVVSSNQVLVICQERDSMNVCIRSPPPWFPVSIPFPVNPSVETSEPWLLQNYREQHWSNSIESVARVVDPPPSIPRSRWKSIRLINCGVSKMTGLSPC